MKIYDANDQELMTVREFAREERHLVIRGKIFGAMPMAAKVKPSELRKALKMMDFRTMLFIASMLFRKD